MQCNQPFIATSPPNCPQFFPYNPGYQPCNSYPDVVGEGEVTTIVLPDGNVQHFFTPTSRWTPYTANPNSFWNPTAGAWYIRSVSSSPQCPLYCQQPSLPCGVPRINFGCNSHMALPPSRGYELKFHNDGRTSTTDLQYFFPRMCQRNIIAQSCAGVQVTTPDCSCKCEVVRDSQCPCSPDCAGSCKTSKKPKENVVCECYKDSKRTAGKDSDMSIDDNKKSCLKKVEKKNKDIQCQYSTSDSSLDRSCGWGKKSSKAKRCDTTCSSTSTSVSDCSTSTRSREKRRKAQEKAWKKQEKIYQKRQKEKEKKRKQERIKKEKANKKRQKKCMSQGTQSDDESFTCSLCESCFDCDSKETSTECSRSCSTDDLLQPSFCALQKERYQVQLKSEKKLKKLLETERKKIEKDRRKQEKETKKHAKTTKQSQAKMNIDCDTDLCNCPSVTEFDGIQSLMSVDRKPTDPRCTIGCQLLNIYEGTTKDFSSEVCTCQPTTNKISATYSEQASGGAFQCIFPSDLTCYKIPDDSDFVD
ncbi:uncharacterized protein LOC126370929 [Pectinophora gossypiella]|uniref:uncharacterized protein LOC126370929 n=1 Tax=Pectinophora gossypiella TaxID=13191 RepID=UPI00214ED43D|nr:uncharacterized protein LOC126370929 [Pectinophora gossypiella]